MRSHIPQQSPEWPPFAHRPASGLEYENARISFNINIEWICMVVEANPNQVPFRTGKHGMDAQWRGPVC